MRRVYAPPGQLYNQYNQNRHLQYNRQPTNRESQSTNNQQNFYKLSTIIDTAKDYRANYEPTQTINTMSPQVSLLLSLLPSSGAVACIELLMWAYDQVGNYKEERNIANQVLKKKINQQNSLFWNRCAFLANPLLCDRSEVGQSAKWLALALEAINHSRLIHDIYRLDHKIVFKHIMNVINKFPPGDTLTLQRLIMNLSHDEMRILASTQALYNIGNQASVPCLANTNIRSRPKIVFTGEDFNNRPTGLLIRRFIDHPPKDMELSIIQIGAKTKSDDAYSFRGTGIKYYEVSKSEEARVILERELFDAIVDTKGLMFKNHCNLLSPRRAPVQIHWLAYPGTIGINTIDYSIGDNEVTPNDPERTEMIEKIIRLPECYQINDDAYKVKPINSNPRFRRRLNRKLIACVNMNYKICPETVLAWIQILKAQPDTDIAIVCRSEQAISNLKNAFSAAHISLDRILAHLGQSRDDFITNLKGEADIVVDPFRCPGHTTASDCYTAGVPVVSLWTDTYYGRVARSLAIQMKLDKELTAYTKEEYIDRVLELLRNDSKLLNIRSQIRYQRRWSSLYDPARYMDHFWNGIRIALQSKKRTNDSKDINIVCKKRFANAVRVENENFTIQDKSNKACTRMLCDANEVLVSPWHNEIWVNGKLITSSLELTNVLNSTSIRAHNQHLPFRKSKRGTLVLQAKQPIMLGIPYPKNINLESTTIIIK